MRNTAFMITALILMTGCAHPLVWSKPGGTQDEFSRDKYACMKQSQQRVSGAYVDRYSGSSASEVITNQNLFNACMNAQGWYLAKQGR